MKKYSAWSKPIREAERRKDGFRWTYIEDAKYWLANNQTSSMEDCRKLCEAIVRNDVKMARHIYDDIQRR